ncbi:hypothetical protein Tco_0738632 [Tanacetum coccineum]
MSSSSKSSRDYSRKHCRAILEPWRQSHNLPPSPPSHQPNKTPPTSPITTNSLSSPSPPLNPTQNQIAHELHNLSNLLEINLKLAIEAANPSPPTSPCIPPPTLDQIIPLRYNLHHKKTKTGAESPMWPPYISGTAGTAPSYRWDFLSINTAPFPAEKHSSLHEIFQSFLSL